MTVFVVVAAPASGGPAFLPEPCAAALQLPGASAAERHATDGFTCATARTEGGAGSLYVSAGVVVAGDVRLDGRADLIRALRDTNTARVMPQRGSSASGGDLALVAASYAQWGTAAVERLRGDFSFVLWDGARRLFLAARDGMGVRPLYYASVPGGICASNALDAVRAHPGVPNALHAPAVVSFLQQGWNRDTSTTTFGAVRRLPPGTLMRRGASDRDAAIITHWRMPDPAPLRYTREEEYLEHYRALLDEAVRDRITGNTTILLSGGLDSTSIAATAARVAPRERLFGLTTRISAVESPDESRLAAAVAARLGMAHEVHEFGLAPLAGTFPRTPEPLDEPHLPAHAGLYRAMARRSPVVLQGEDGDALFSPPSLRAMLRRYPMREVLGRVATYTVLNAHHPYMGFWLARRLGIMRAPKAPVRPPWLVSRAGPPAAEAERPPNAARPEAAQRLVGSIWQSVHQGLDRAFLGAPVEHRWPLLDTRLLEFVFAIPPIPWCQRKFLVRRAYARELPGEVIGRPKTTVPGSFEFAVAEWRARTGGSVPELHPQTAEFVDSGILRETLHGGDTDTTMAGWRALLLDRWLRDREAA